MLCNVAQTSLIDENSVDIINNQYEDDQLIFEEVATSIEEAVIISCEDAIEKLELYFVRGFGGSRIGTCCRCGSY